MAVHQERIQFNSRICIQDFMGCLSLNINFPVHNQQAGEAVHKKSPENLLQPETLITLNAQHPIKRPEPRPPLSHPHTSIKHRNHLPHLDRERNRGRGRREERRRDRLASPSLISDPRSRGVVITPSFSQQCHSQQVEIFTP
jgi:hypothetical protein